MRKLEEGSNRVNDYAKQKVQANAKEAHENNLRRVQVILDLSDHLHQSVVLT